MGEWVCLAVSSSNVVGSDSRSEVAPLRSDSPTMERTLPGPGKGARVPMNEKDGWVAHRRMVAGREILRNYGRNNNSLATGITGELIWWKVLRRSHRWRPKRRGAFFWKTRVSRPAEFHHRPLAEPDGNLSAHPAPIKQTSQSNGVFDCRTHRSPPVSSCLGHATA